MAPPRGFQRVLLHEAEKCGSGQACGELADQLGGIDIPQGVIHDDQMRGQIRGAHHREVRPRHPEEAEIPGQSSQSLLHLFPDTFLRADEEDS